LYKKAKVLKLNNMLDLNNRAKNWLPIFLIPQEEKKQLTGSK